MQRIGVSGKAITDLEGVNRAFLELMTTGAPVLPDTGCFGLAADTIYRVRMLDDRCRRRVGHGQFPLFSVRFHDIAAWSAVLERGVRDEVGALTWPADGGRVQQFLVMALAAIRGVAAREPVSASVLFGVPALLVADLSRIEIRALPGIAKAVTPWLRARCAAKTGWWERMIVSACQEGEGGVDNHRGVHSSLLGALSLGEARLPEGRLYRRQ